MAIVWGNTEEEAVAVTTQHFRVDWPTQVWSGSLVCWKDKKEQKAGHHGDNKLHSVNTFNAASYTDLSKSWPRVFHTHQHTSSFARLNLEAIGTVLFIPLQAAWCNGAKAHPSSITPFATQSSHSLDRAVWQAKMASIEVWIPWCNAHGPHCASVGRFCFKRPQTISSAKYDFRHQTLHTMGAVRITSLNPKFNGSHFGLPPSSIPRMTGWVTNSRILWRMRTAPIMTIFSDCTRVMSGLGEKEKKKTVFFSFRNRWQCKVRVWSENQHHDLMLTLSRIVVPPPTLCTSTRGHAGHTHTHTPTWSRPWQVTVAMASMTSTLSDVSTPLWIYS